MKLSKQMAQLYRVPLDEEDFHRAMAGQFVNSGHDNDDHVIGFINLIDKETCEMEICLFHPQVLPSNVTKVIAETLTFDETSDMLKKICDANPDVKAAWYEVANGPTYEEDPEQIH